MKLTKFLLIAGAAMCLASCDGLGGLFGPGDDEEEGEFNPNLYTLQLKVNLQGAEFQNLGLEYEAMDEEEMDFLVSEYGSKGLTKENLQKVGTFENGKYYFMEQDGFRLKAPQVVGYELLGWYNGDKKIDGGIDYDYDGITDYKVNMPGSNLVLEARYAPVEFKFRVSSITDNKDDSGSTLVSWKITDGDLDLSQYLSDDESKTFKQWDLIGYYFDVSEGLANVEQGQQLDPRCYKTVEKVTKIDKSVLSELGDVAYGYVNHEMDLIASYDVKQCSVTINWTYGLASFAVMTSYQNGAFQDVYDVRWIEAHHDDGTYGESYSMTLTLKWGTKVKIYYSLSVVTYNFDGYYDGDTYLGNGNEYTFDVAGDKAIDIKVSQI